MDMMRTLIDWSKGSFVGFFHFEQLKQ